MQLPRQLVFVRHGESLANVALRRYKETGLEDLYWDDLCSMHTAEVPLTEPGIAQAKAAGEWIRSMMRGRPFDRYYTTSYRRGMETAINLGLSHAEWLFEWAIRERDWGDMETVRPSERELRWPDFEKRKAASPYHFLPVGGESFSDAFERIFRFLEYMGRTYPDSSIICVSHYEIIQCARIVIEHIYEFDFIEREAELGLHNCDVLVYEQTRQGLEYRIFRNTSGEVTAPRSFSRKGYTNEELARKLYKK